MKNEVDAKNFQVNAEPFPTGVVWAQIVKATRNGAIPNRTYYFTYKYQSLI